MRFELRELRLQDAREEYDMIVEIGPGENGFVNSMKELSYDEFREKLHSFIELSKGINLPPQYVPQTIFWLYINDKPVGYGKLRHYLNDQLKELGGHIGYIIRPSERGKGYGKLMLQELLKQAKLLNIAEVMLTCNEDNVYSRKVIEANDGQLTEVKDDKCKYWITLA